jgi:hypothetical protein
MSLTKPEEDKELDSELEKSISGTATNQTICI